MGFFGTVFKTSALPWWSWESVSLFTILVFFGGIPGPLSPDCIGDVLAGMGISDRHLLILCLSLTAVALSWNWLYNAVGRLPHGSTAGAGRQIPEFQRRVVKKGTIGHFMWMMFLVFSIIIFYHM